ncbi:MAG: threonine ammonia-lyase [Candidatus Limivicinus sp.]|jgi:threonine dehydratase
MSERLSPAEVLSAYERIKDYIYETPLEESPYLGSGGRRYFFKLESAHRVKSFKIRGALSKITTLTGAEKEKGVATVSSGNHGIAVSYASKLLGITNALIIVPKCTPKAKTDRIKFFGGQVMLLGENYDEAHRLGLQYIAEQGMTYIDAYDNDEKVYAGQGTVALEILKQNPDIDTIVLPIGGGGLITGAAVAAKALKPGIRIIGVQTEVCTAMIRALQDNVYYGEYPCSGNTVCESLVGGVGRLAFSMLGDYADDIIAVRESTIRKAVKHMILQEKFIVEGGSAAVLAAVMEAPERVGGKNVALVMSGGNIDADLITEIINEE